MLANASLLFLTVSNLLASPFIIHDNLLIAQNLAVSQSYFKRFYSNFFFSTSQFGLNNVKFKFEKSCFSNFLSTSVNIDSLNVKNSTFITQKTIYTLSDILIDNCRFINCESRSNIGGAILVRTSISTFSSNADTNCRLSIHQASFFNCSALSNGAISIQFKGSLTFDQICFNACRAKVSNSVGQIYLDNQDIISISLISIFRCPYSLQSKNIHDCLVLKNSLSTFSVSFLNTTNNVNNQSRGCILSFAQNSLPSTVYFSTFVNNSGSDGFSILEIRTLSFVSCNFIDNTFSIAPFNSYGASPGIKTFSIRLEHAQYYNNRIVPISPAQSHITGSIYITLYFGNYDLSIYNFGNDTTVTIISSTIHNETRPTYSYEYYDTEICHFIPTSEVPSKKKYDEKVVAIIFYILLAMCVLVLVIGCSILAFSYIKKQRSLHKWISVNETNSGVD